MIEVEAFIEAVTPAIRRRDARTLLGLMGRVTGEQPSLRGTMIGFGSYHYHYASGREGVSAAASFAPRKAALTIYLLDGIDAHTEALGRLGPHTRGVGCLNVKNLDEVDLAVLESIVASSYASLTAGTMTDRARDAGSERPLPRLGRPATTALHLAGYRSLDSLAGAAKRTLLGLHGVGPKAIREVDQALSEAGWAPLTD